MFRQSFQTSWQLMISGDDIDFEDEGNLWESMAKKIVPNMMNKVDKVPFMRQRIFGACELADKFGLL